MWDLGVERALHKFLEDPDVRALVKAKNHRTVDDSSTFYGSDQFKKLDADCAGALTNDDMLTILISIGGDGVQLLNWGKRTATVIAIKCEDLPPHLVQSAKAVTPIMIIEGPQEPGNLNHILMKTIDFLVLHAPSTDGEGESITDLVLPQLADFSDSRGRELPF